MRILLLLSIILMLVACEKDPMALAEKEALAEVESRCSIFRSKPSPTCIEKGMQNWRDLYEKYADDLKARGIEPTYESLSLHKSKITINEVLE